MSAGSCFMVTETAMQVMMQLIKFDGWICVSYEHNNNCNDD